MFNKDFEKAISNMPSPAKDKLIIKLLKKDLKLASKMYFEMVETKSTEEIRAELEQHIINSAKVHAERFYSIGYLNMDVRFLSGDIAEHVRITRDKEGEPGLHILLLTEVLRLNKENIMKARPPIKLSKFCAAVMARCFKILLLLSKLHEDILLDYKADLNKLGNIIGGNRVLMNAAIYHGMDVNWIINGEVPSDLTEIHKDLRDRGYLR